MLECGMPRARTTTAEDTPVVAKKPRAPRTRRVVDVDSERAPVASRRTLVDTTDRAKVVRKAPTPLRATHVRQTRKEHGLLFVVGGCLMLFGIGFGIGLSDRGVIDVVAVVTERNEKINRGEVRDASGNTITRTVGVQNQTTEPNGGLILADPSLIPTPVAPPELSSSTATTTAVQATTTVPVSDETATTTTVES